MLTRCQSRQLPKGRQASIVRRDGNFGAAGGWSSATKVPKRDRGGGPMLQPAITLSACACRRVGGPSTQRMHTAHVVHFSGSFAPRDKFEGLLRSMLIEHFCREKIQRRYSLTFCIFLSLIGYLLLLIPSADLFLKVMSSETPLVTNDWCCTNLAARAHSNSVARPHRSHRRLCKPCADRRTARLRDRHSCRHRRQ